jgi:hypothetical protein
MIGKWICWPPSILCSIPLDQEEKGRTSFGGTRLAKGLSMLDHFTRLLLTVFFVWSASLGKILTLDNLRRRQVIMVNRCCLCKLEGESVDHLLLHCEVAHTLWNTILSRFGLSLVMPNSVVDLMFCWWSRGNSRSTVV